MSVVLLDKEGTKIVIHNGEVFAHTVWDRFVISPEGELALRLLNPLGTTYLVEATFKAACVFAFKEMDKFATSK